MPKVLVQMVRQLNKEILDKVEEIVGYIKDTPEYKNYLKAKELLSHDTELTTLIEKVKKYQKEIVNNKNKESELELKINECLDTLNSSPLYIEFMNYQTDVNNMLTIFENKINKYFDDVFNQVIYE